VPFTLLVGFPSFFRIRNKILHIFFNFHVFFRRGIVVKTGWIFLLLFMFIFQIENVGGVYAAQANPPTTYPGKIIPGEGDHKDRKIVTVEMERVELKSYQHSAQVSDYYLPKDTYTMVVIKNTGKYPIHYSLYTWDDEAQDDYLLNEGIVLPHKEETLTNVMFEYAYNVKLTAKGPGLFGIPGLYRHHCKATAIMYIRLREGAKIRTGHHEHLP
jgi:hypothetical protein